MLKENKENYTQEKTENMRKAGTVIPQYLGNSKAETQSKQQPVQRRGRKITTKNKGVATESEQGKSENQPKQVAPKKKAAATKLQRPTAKNTKAGRENQPKKADQPVSVKQQPVKQQNATKPTVAKQQKTTKPTVAKAVSAKPRKAVKKGKGKNPVKILFLGGVGEIGKNMTAIEYGNDIVIIDAGLTFPDEELPGIDLVIPDISYLVQNKQKVRGLLITHGHEDHLGGLPYFLKEVNCPVYATKLTLALADNKLREHRINNAQMICVEPGDKIKLGCFGVEFINVNHSISGAIALAIDTPQGKIVHSGDFKIDLTPVAGAPIDLKRMAQLGEEGVKLFMCESTNVERQGYTMSETVVGTTLDHLFAEHSNRRIIVATFASNVHRLQQIVDLAVKYRRHVALSGRSMLNVVDAATKIGELIIPEGVLIDIEKIKNYFDREIVIVSTGSQGEPMSALTRMANGDFNKVVIGSNDTIIISASPIPGNEKMIYKVINNLYRKGAEVVYESLEKIHVSGHACQEELKILHTLLKPQFFIPVHGEYRHLKRHARLAMDLGMSENNILITDIGNCVELTKDAIQFGESVTSGSRLVDGGSLEDQENSLVMKDRIHLSEDGIFVITACVSERCGELLSDPIVVDRGFVMPENADYIAEIGRIVVNCAKQVDIMGDVENTEFAAAIKKAVKNFIYKKTKQNPVIMANIVRL